MSQQDFAILKSNLVNALTLVGGGRVNADALTAYAALYIAELDAFYRDERRVPTSLEAKSPIGADAGAGLKEDARRGVESALLRLASRAFGGAGRTNLTSGLEPYELARRTLGLAKDEARKTLDYLVSLERRGPHALTPQQKPPPAQTPMRKGSKRTPLRDVNANTESPVKKKSKNLKKAVPRSNGVTIQDQNAMAILMSSTKRVDWTGRPRNEENEENEEKPRVVTGKPVGKSKNKEVKATLKDEGKRASASVSASVALGPARAYTPAPVATSTLKNKVNVAVKGNSSVSSSATPTAVAARATSVATSTLKNKVKVEAKDDTSVSYFASPAAVARATTTLHHASSSSIATTASKADKIRVKSEKST